MIDLRRLGGIAVSAAFLAACLGLSELAMGATSPWWPAWLRNDWGNIEYPARQLIGARVAGVVKESRGRPAPLGVVLGASYQTYGVDVASLESGVEPRHRWLRLTVPGSTVCELAAMARLLLDEGRVRPGYAVITLAPKMMARSETFRDPGIDRFAVPKWDRIVEHLRGMKLAAAERDVENLVTNAFDTLFPDRLRIYYRLSNRAVQWRAALLAGFGQGIVADFSPSADPWPDPEPEGGNPAEDDWLVLTDRQRGVFDPRAYAGRRDSHRALVEMIGRFRSVGTSVVVVIMPERSDFRAATIPEARQALRAALEDAASEGPLRVVDLESQVKDDGFLDMHHVSERGRARVTRRLIEALNGDRSSPALASSPPRGRSILASERVP